MGLIGGPSRQKQKASPWGEAVAGRLMRGYCTRAFTPHPSATPPPPPQGEGLRLSSATHRQIKIHHRKSITTNQQSQTTQKTIAGAIRKSPPETISKYHLRNAFVSTSTSPLIAQSTGKFIRVITPSDRSAKSQASEGAESAPRKTKMQNPTT